MRASVVWIFFAERVIKSRLPATSACSALRIFEMTRAARLFSEDGVDLIASLFKYESSPGRTLAGLPVHRQARRQAGVIQSGQGQMLLHPDLERKESPDDLFLRSNSGQAKNSDERIGLERSLEMLTLTRFRFGCPVGDDHDDFTAE